MDSTERVSAPKRKMEEIYQCVICLEVPAGRVYQCQSGHLTCEDCDEKNTVCPVCRQPHTANKRMRNRAVEQSIEAMDFPKACRNKGKGCDFSAKSTELGNHKDKCEHRLVPCPDIGCPNEVQFNFLLTHLKMSGGGRVVQELNMLSGRAGHIKFNVHARFRAERDVNLCGTIFRYLGNHFVLNFNKVADTHYVWISVIGDAELADDFFVKMTLGKGQMIKITQRSKVFPISIRWEDIFKESDGVLAFGKVGNGQDAFFREEGGRTIFSIFVEFLKPVIKEEEKGMEYDIEGYKMFQESLRSSRNKMTKNLEPKPKADNNKSTPVSDNEPMPSISRNVSALLEDWEDSTPKIKQEVDNDEPTYASVVASTSTMVPEGWKAWKALNNNPNIKQMKSKFATKQKNKPGPKCSKISTLPIAAATRPPNLLPAEIDALKNSDDPGYLLAHYGIKGEEGVNWLLDQRSSDPDNVKLYEEMIALMLSTL